MEDNTTFISSSRPQSEFEFRIALVVGITFSITFFVGLIGNSLVLLTVLLQKQMRNATNILILNLAIVELLFIILCVPFTGLNYVLSLWYFGDIACRIVQYTSNVTAYLIVMLLVFMSVDRYLAMHSFSSNKFRSKKNAIRAVSILWLVVLTTNLPQLYLHSHHEYLNHNETRTVCILKYNIILLESTENDPIIEEAEFKIQIYYSIFIMFAYVVPFISIVILYSLLILKLKKQKGKQVSKGKRRITFMIIAVISSFALCWAPIQIMLFLQHVMKMPFGETEITLLVLSNCIGYMNTCINPIIYGFANRDFRTAYAAILKCEYHSKKYTNVGIQIKPQTNNNSNSNRTKNNDFVELNKLPKKNSVKNTNKNLKNDNSITKITKNNNNNYHNNSIVLNSKKSEQVQESKPLISRKEDNDCINNNNNEKTDLSKIIFI